MSQINTEENKRSAIPNNINKVSNKTYEEQKSNHYKKINKKNSEINESIINNNSNNSIINNKENYKDHLNYNQDKKLLVQISIANLKMQTAILMELLKKRM